MKKIIAVTAGLMLAGSIVASANAATINFNGDARARFIYEKNYWDGSGKSIGSSLSPKDTKQEYWTSRVRLQFKIETKGGAYAVGRFRLADGTWDGNSNPGANKNSTMAYGEKSNLYADVAYVGVPMGPVTIEGGLLYPTVSMFLRKDDPYDVIRAVYKTDQTTVALFGEKLSEYASKDVTTTDAKTGLATTKTVIDNNMTSDDDIQNIGVNLIQKFGGGWSVNGLVLYHDNQQKDLNGFIVDAIVAGKAGPVDLVGEFIYKEKDVQLSTGGLDDNGYGGYVGARVPMGGSAAITMVGGMTGNGFVAGSDFGAVEDVTGFAPFVMLSGATAKSMGMLNTGILVGSATGDAYFFNVAPCVKVSDKLTLVAEGSYVNADVGKDSVDIWEIGGIAQYKVTDGAAITAMLGYLDIENADENPLAFGLALDLKF